MAIRILEEQGGTRPAPLVNAPSGAFGGGPEAAGAYDAAGKLARQGSDEMMAQKRKADQVVVSEATAKAMVLKQGLLSKASMVRGKNAFNLMDEVPAAYQKGLQEIEKGLSDPDQQLAFKEVSRNNQLDLMAQIDHHVLREKNEYDIQATSAEVAAYQNEGITHPEDADRHAVATQNIEQILTHNAQRLGLPSDVKDKNILEAVAKMNMGVVSRLLAQGRPQKAMEFFQGHKTSFGDKVAQVEGAVNQAMQEFLGPDAAFSAAFHGLQAAGLAAKQDPFLLGRMDLEKPNTALLGSMNDLQRQSLGETEALIRSGARPATDYNVHSAMTSLIAQAQTDPTAEKRFKELDLNLYWPRLSPEHMAYFGGIQTKMRQGKGSAEGHQIQMNDTIYKDALATMGIQQPYSPKERDEAAKFKFMVEQRLNQEYAQTGKRPGFEDSRRIAGEMMKDVITGKGWFGKPVSKKAYQLEPGQVKAPATATLPGNEMSVMVTDPPKKASQLGPTADERRALAFELAANGYAVTESSIQTLWERKKKKGSAGGKY